jgi:dTDP-glucose 4,6-dehydratase
MKTYLVTGGAGFIGSNFIHYMLKKYQDSICIVNIDKLTYAGNLINLRGLDNLPNYHFVKADINDSTTIFPIFAKYKPEIIINFAAETHVDRSINNPGIFVYSNIMGTQSLLDASLKYPVDRFIQISTDEVYGSLSTEGAFTENSPLKPSSPYSASKAGADLMAYAYYKTYGLPVIISRCSNNYGPHQFPEKLIPLTIEHCLNNIPIPIYGDGKHIRDWLYVTDHCAAVDNIAAAAPIGEVYNIGGSCEVENMAMVRTIIRVVQDTISPHDPRRKFINPGLIRHVDDRKGHDRRYAIDSSKIRAELNWQAQIGLTEGIQRTVDWYIANKATNKI